MAAQEQTKPRSQPEKRPSNMRRRLKHAAQQVLARFPRIYARIVPLYRACKWSFIQRRWARQASHRTHDRFLEPWAILHVPPTSIRFSVGREFSAEKGLGRVVDGDWDLCQDEFVELDVYRALGDVVAGKASWPQTEFYRRVTRSIKNGGVHWGCVNTQEFDRRCKSLETLYADIATNGYKSVAERGSRADEPLSHFGLDEIGVAIGRDGALLFTNGAHRLTIARLLDLPSIPVQVLVRHPLWMRFRHELANYAERHGGRVREPITHPDLADIPAEPYCPRRLALVEQHLRAHGGPVLDVEPGWGFLAFVLERKGFTCTVLQEESEDLGFLRRLKQIYCSGIAIRSGPMSAVQPDEASGGLLLALDGLHRFVRNHPSSEALGDWLEQLNLHEAFLAGDANTVEFLMDHARLRHLEQIAVPGYKPVFHLWRD